MERWSSRSQPGDPELCWGGGSEAERAERCGDPGRTERREQDGRGRRSRGSDGSPGPPALAVVGAGRDARAV